MLDPWLATIHSPIWLVTILKCIGPSTYKCGLSLVALTYMEQQPVMLGGLACWPDKAVT